jgi:hypothetical protein
MSDRAAYRRCNPSAVDLKDSPPVTRSRSGLLLLWFAAGSVSCRSEYPLRATFCDDWCLATQATRCQEPENCVRDCELKRAGPECRAAEQSLLSCYQQKPPTDFVCAGDGFDAQVRVRPEVCREERDTLLECTVPNMRVCLGWCRPTQAAQLAAADAGTAPFLVTADAGADICPALDEPCETLCSTILGLGAALSVGTAVAPGLEGTTQEAATSDRTLACVQQALASCVTEVAPLPSGTGSFDAGAEFGPPLAPPADPIRAVRRPSITTVLVRCAGEPGG